jgi:hypothetical protein
MANALKGMSRSSQLLVGAGLLLFIFLFFDWQQRHGAGRSGWHGWGLAAGIFVIALVVWEAAQVLGIKVVLPIAPAMLSAVLAAGVLVFTLIKFFDDDKFRHWPAWVGLILAILIAVGGVLRWSGGAVKLWERPARSPPAS